MKPPEAMRYLRHVFVGALGGLLILFAATTLQAATDTGVYVEIRESDSPDAPVAERWKLYGASYALVIGIDNYSTAGRGYRMQSKMQN